MTGVSAATSRIRLAAAASAVAAAATLAPAAVAQGSPLTPAPPATFGMLGGDTVSACDPGISVCASLVASIVGNASIAAAQSPFQNSLFWFGAANADFQPLVGIVFPNIFGWDFEACALGGAVRFDPYSGSGFIGLGAGC